MQTNTDFTRENLVDLLEKAGFRILSSCDDVFPELGSFRKELGLPPPVFSVSVEAHGGVINGYDSVSRAVWKTFPRGAMEFSAVSDPPGEDKVTVVVTKTPPAAPSEQPDPDSSVGGFVALRTGSGREIHVRDSEPPTDCPLDDESKDPEPGTEGPFVVAVRAHHPSDHGNAAGAIHLALSEDLTSGRLSRKKGDALCKPASKFWGLYKGSPGDKPSCKRCIAMANRHDLDIRKTSENFPGHWSL